MSSRSFAVFRRSAALSVLPEKSELDVILCEALLLMMTCPKGSSRSAKWRVCLTSCMRSVLHLLLMASASFARSNLRQVLHLDKTRAAGST